MIDGGIYEGPGGADLHGSGRKAESPDSVASKCKFCGSVKVQVLDKWGHCAACVEGMERTKGD